MVQIGNVWDEILKDEFAKEYYQNIRKFLVYEYNHHPVYPSTVSYTHLTLPTTSLV